MAGFQHLGTQPQPPRFQGGNLLGQFQSGQRQDKQLGQAQQRIEQAGVAQEQAGKRDEFAQRKFAAGQFGTLRLKLMDFLKENKGTLPPERVKAINETITGLVGAEQKVLNVNTPLGGGQPNVPEGVFSQTTPEQDIGRRQGLADLTARTAGRPTSAEQAVTQAAASTLKASKTEAEIAKIAAQTKTETSKQTALAALASKRIKGEVDPRERAKIQGLVSERGKLVAANVAIQEKVAEQEAIISRTVDAILAAKPDVEEIDDGAFVEFGKEGFFDKNFKDLTAAEVKTIRTSMIRSRLQKLMGAQIRQVIDNRKTIKGIDSEFGKKPAANKDKLENIDAIISLGNL